MKRIYVISIAVIILAVATGATYYAKRVYGNAKNPDPNHTHADFAVWIEGSQWDFSQPKYMTGLSTETHDDEEGLKKYLHLHDGNGHMMHRHKPALTLADFFSTIGFTLVDKCVTTDEGTRLCKTDTKRWKLYVNGYEMPYNPLYIFLDGDHILLSYGLNDEDVTAQLSKLTHDACLYSQTCPWRGKPPVENCIADPDVPCTIN